MGKKGKRSSKQTRQKVVQLKEIKDLLAARAQMPVPKVKQ